MPQRNSLVRDSRSAIGLAFLLLSSATMVSMLTVLDLVGGRQFLLLTKVPFVLMVALAVLPKGRWFMVFALNAQLLVSLLVMGDRMNVRMGLYIHLPLLAIWVLYLLTSRDRGRTVASDTGSKVEPGT